MLSMKHAIVTRNEVLKKNGYRATTSVSRCNDFKNWWAFFTIKLICSPDFLFSIIYIYINRVTPNITHYFLYDMWRVVIFHPGTSFGRIVFFKSPYSAEPSIRVNSGFGHFFEKQIYLFLKWNIKKSFDIRYI